MPFILILVLTALAGIMHLAWWTVAIIAFVVAFVSAKRAGQSIWSGFGGVSIGWIIVALMKSLPNDNLLATRVAALFHLPHWTLLLIIMGLIGGLVGGFAAYSGLLVKRVFEKPTLSLK
ncbi:hypothetical protein [Mucilaginibacter lacusdianchii]|uniref:hypothetical protein n=1 Tax=Mucilaginibacter lacusdianchii TaxID=2684211 RepID=UPI00131B22C0|nr:hypothetical protein [Mucilaginibacter sp. JXJ CY 39]